MNEYFMGITLITLAALGIGAVYGNFLVLRIRDFLPLARNRERLVDLAKETPRKIVDDMLVAIPEARAANLSNTADVPVQYLSQGTPSPFGDW
jgi:hypothetical protein